MEEKFKNGDKVKYSYGLTFIYVGLDPDDNNKAYCIHPTSTYKKTESELEKPNKEVVSLYLNRLTLV